MNNAVTIFATILLLVKPICVIAMPPILADVKSCVAFIFVPNEERELLAQGTGFFVGVEDHQKARVFGYFVTAKHVLQKADEKSFHEQVYLRLNTKKGATEVMPIPLVPAGKEKNLFVHEGDQTVDLAVIPILPNRKKYDFKYVPDHMIVNKADVGQLEIREGSEVFFMGLFGHHMGKQKNQPITRFGRIALFTTEKISWKRVETELYLIECTSYGGNSGSPVFYYAGAEREPGKLHVGKPVLKLVGVLKGYMEEGWPVQTVKVAKHAFVWESSGVVDVYYQNIGISAVIPAHKLREILSCEELKKQRNLKY